MPEIIQWVVMQQGSSSEFDTLHPLHRQVCCGVLSVLLFSLHPSVLILCVQPAAKREEYAMFEHEVYETLASLVRDASSLRVYLAAAMKVEAETFILATS